MITEKEKKIFGDVLKKLSEAGLSRHIMLIGSWAEFIYETTNLLGGYISAIRTNDIDFLVMNLRKPPHQTEFLSIMKDSGFETVLNRADEVTKFIAPNQDMEVEFLIHEMGVGQNKGYPVESLGFSVTGLRHLNILRDNPIMTEYHGSYVVVPKPEAYMLHKLVINKKRSENKQTKDMNSVQLISEALFLHSESVEELRKIWDTLTEKEQLSAQRTMDNPELYEIGKVFSSFALKQELSSSQNVTISSQHQHKTSRAKGMGGK